MHLDQIWSSSLICFEFSIFIWYCSFNKLLHLKQFIKKRDIWKSKLFPIKPNRRHRHFLLKETKLDEAGYIVKARLRARSINVCVYVGVV